MGTSNGNPWVGVSGTDSEPGRWSQRVLKIPEDISAERFDSASVPLHSSPPNVFARVRLTSETKSTIEFLEVREEAVPGKQLQVVEEIAVVRSIASHVQHIHERVRHTEVEIQQIPEHLRET